MPAKEPLTKKGKLSDRGKAKLQSQIDRAEKIMKRSDKFGKNSSTYWDAQKVRARAYKLLGKTAPKASPGGKSSSKARTGVRAAGELVRRAKSAGTKVKRGMDKARKASESAGGSEVREGRGIKGRGAWERAKRR